MRGTGGGFQDTKAFTFRKGSQRGAPSRKFVSGEETPLEDGVEQLHYQKHWKTCKTEAGIHEGSHFR